MERPGNEEVVGEIVGGGVVRLKRGCDDPSLPLDIVDIPPASPKERCRLDGP